MLLVKGAHKGHACDSHYLECAILDHLHKYLLYHILCVMLLYHWFIIFKWSNYFIVFKSSNNEYILITKCRTTVHLWPYKNCFTHTVNRERFTRLNICGFNLMKFSLEYFCGALASDVYYSTIAKYSQENFHSTLKNRKCLAQWIFPHLWYNA